MIQKKYNPDEIGRRILNGDGGSWIKEPYDDEAVFQLDRYHIYHGNFKEISSKAVQKDIRRLFDSEKIEEMFAYIREYIRVSKSEDESDKTCKKPRNCTPTFTITEKGCCRTTSGNKTPRTCRRHHYKNMGIQETQNCTSDNAENEA